MADFLRNHILYQRCLWIITHKIVWIHLKLTYQICWGRTILNKNIYRLKQCLKHLSIAFCECFRYPACVFINILISIKHTIITDAYRCGYIICKYIIVWIHTTRYNDIKVAYHINKIPSFLSLIDSSFLSHVFFFLNVLLFFHGRLYFFVLGCLTVQNVTSQLHMNQHRK